MIQRAYKFRLYPTPEQKQKLLQCGGNARWLWNYFLCINEKEYAKSKKFIFAHDLMKMLPLLKKEHEFLSLSWSQSLQQVAWHFDRALKDFLNPELQREFPVVKKKSKERDSFTYCEPEAPTS
jgi:putative transposase